MPNHRESYEGAAVRVPGCRMVGWLSFQQAQPAGLEPHHHTGAWELCLITRGKVDWWVEDEVWEIGAGQVYLTRPDERHGAIDTALQPCELFWTGFSFLGRSRLGGLEKADREALAQRFNALRQRRFPADDRLTDAFMQLRDAHRDPDGRLPRLAARLAFGQLLWHTLRCHDHAATVEPSVSPAVGRALAWMGQHLADDFAIDEAADVAGLSVTRFHERFAAEVGLPPGEWRTRQRVRRAKIMLRQTERSVTEIALRCGFSTSQYFATTFRKHTGQSPSAYRRAGVSRPHDDTR